MTHKELLQKIAEVAPEGMVYRLDDDGLLFHHPHTGLYTILDLDQPSAEAAFLMLDAMEKAGGLEPANLNKHGELYRCGVCSTARHFEYNIDWDADFETPDNIFEGYGEKRAIAIGRAFVQVFEKEGKEEC